MWKEPHPPRPVWTAEGFYKAPGSIEKRCFLGTSSDTKSAVMGTSSDFWEQAPSDALEQEQLKTYLFQSLCRSLCR